MTMKELPDGALVTGKPKRKELNHIRPFMMKPSKKLKLNS